MSMITRCPSCTTAFRVTPQQLQAQHGMVRCGRCAMVFDGFKTLAAQRADAPPESPPAIAVSSPPGDLAPPPASEVAVPAAPDAVESVPAVVITEQAGDAQYQPAVASDTTPPESPAEVEQAAPETAEPAAPGVERAAAALPQGTPAVSAARTKRDEITYQVSEMEKPRKRSAGLALGSFMMLIALAAQGVYFYRGEIAANLPETRPYLNQICAQLRCTVALPQRPQQIKIAASDVQATDPANPGLMVVTATLRSESAIAVGYPALDVVLTNVKDHTVARRIFLPSEYLDAGKDVRAGIAPNAEFTVALNIDSGDLGAAGFRLDVLAAPLR